MRMFGSVFGNIIFRALINDYQRVGCFFNYNLVLQIIWIQRNYYVKVYILSTTNNLSIIENLLKIS